MTLFFYVTAMVKAPKTYTLWHTYKLIVNVNNSAAVCACVLTSKKGMTVFRPPFTPSRKLRNRAVHAINGNTTPLRGRTPTKRRSNSLSNLRQNKKPKIVTPSRSKPQPPLSGSKLFSKDWHRKKSHTPSDPDWSPQHTPTSQNHVQRISNKYHTPLWFSYNKMPIYPTPSLEKFCRSTVVKLHDVICTLLILRNFWLPVTKSLQTNFQSLPTPLQKLMQHLSQHHYHSLYANALSTSFKSWSSCISAKYGMILLCVYVCGCHFRDNVSWVRREIKNECSKTIAPLYIAFLSTVSFIKQYSYFRF